MINRFDAANAAFWLDMVPLARRSRARQAVALDLWAIMNSGPLNDIVGRAAADRRSHDRLRVNLITALKFQPSTEVDAARSTSELKT